MSEGTPSGPDQPTPPRRGRWRTGDFDRARVHEVFHNFVPAHAVNSLQEVDLDRLWTAGKRLILVDVDHTLVKWKSMDFAQPVLDWIARAKGMGFEFCIISNTRRVHRLQKLSQMLEIETVRGRFKPSRAMFRLALIKFKRKPEEAVMIGDQLMTDILGANRAGIDAIWVRKMEGKEFGPTKINRMMESLLQSAIYRGLVTPVDETPGPNEGKKPFLQRTIVRQFVKFAIVGGSSFIVDTGIRLYLSFYAPWFEGRSFSDTLGSWLRDNWALVAENFATPQKAAWPICVTIGATFGILNSFIWNRFWTFKIRGKEERLAQLRRFVFISVIGLLLNTVISSALNNIIQGHEKRSAFLATVIAAVVVAFWNFNGQRLYAFRTKAK